MQSFQRTGESNEKAHSSLKTLSVAEGILIKDKWDLRVSCMLVASIFLLQKGSNADQNLTVAGDTIFCNRTL